MFIVMEDKLHSHLAGIRRGNTRKKRKRKEERG
jgi:hypothetical protein